MVNRIRLLVILLLLLLVATTAYGAFDEQHYKAWYGDYFGGTIVGERHQSCMYAYQWGVETQFELYYFIEYCG